MKILSLDPSLRAFGWAIIDDKIEDCGCIETERSLGSKPESDTLNITQLSSELKRIIDLHKPALVIYESPVGSKSSRANQALAYVKSLVISMCIFSNLPSRPFAAKNAKKILVGKTDASKEEMYERVTEEYPELEDFLKKLTKVKKYAISDAVSIHFAYKNS